MGEHCERVMAGLYVLTRPEQFSSASAVALEAVTVLARIIDLCTQTTVAQQYCNREACAIEGSR